MFRPLTLLVLLGTVGCGALRDNQPQVDRALLAHISENDRQAVATERKDLDNARDDYATARSDRERAELALDLTKDELDLAQQRVEAKRSAVALVQRPGGREDVKAVEDDLMAAMEMEEALQIKVKLRQNQLELADAVVEFEDARVELAEARVELAMAQAVTAIDRQDVDKVDLERYQERVSEARTDVEVAKVRMEAAAEDVAHFQDLFDQAGGEEAMRPFKRVDGPSDRDSSNRRDASGGMDRSSGMESSSDTDDGQGES